MAESPRERFQVDLRGVISLLSRNLYSTSGVYVRELLQNAHDALAARRSLDPGFTGDIRVVPVGIAAHGSPASELAVIDDGIGLTLAEVESVLSSVGASSKRDVLDLPRDGFLGRFGIGLLSCFLVSDEIVVSSRSAHGGRAVEWRGSSDGTYVARELDDDLPIGTRVRVTPRPGEERLLEPDSVAALVRHYAEFLPSSVSLATAGADRHLTGAAPFLLDHEERREDVMEYGAGLIGRRPFAAIPFDVPATQTRGVAYVLPHAPAATVAGPSRVYAGGMLICEHQEDLTPEWAFFVRVVADSRGLSPTASRESFVSDDALDETRERIGLTLRTWVMELGTRHPERMAEFIEAHALSLKMMALQDDEFARFIVRWLPLETSNGVLPIGEIVRTNPHVRFTTTVDEFRQVAALASGDVPLVNGGYTFDSDILTRLPAVFDGVTVETVDVVSILDDLTPPPLEDRARAGALESRVATTLADEDCEVVVRRFARADPSAMLVRDPGTIRRMDRRLSRTRGTGAAWAAVFDRVDEFGVDAGAVPRTRLCLNWENRVVRALETTDDPAVFPLIARVLYVQALMAGFHPLTPRDRATLSASLADLIVASVGLGPGSEDR